MRSRLSAEFVALFSRLPPEVQRVARKNYQLWRQDLSHPGVRFKPVENHNHVYSVRVGLKWRALGLVEGDTITWFWIGSHSDYDKIVG